VTFKGAPRGNPSSVFSFDADLLQGDKDGKLGIAATAEVKLDILTGPIAKLSAASLRFEGETATSGDSRAFKEALKLESNFVWRVRGVGEYFAIVAKPLFLEADDNLRTINYKGSLGFATEVPLTQDLGALLQDALGRCTYKSGNCSQWGMTAGVSYGFNSKWKRQAGRFDRSDDTVTIAEAVWDLPLNNKLGLFAKYSWQSDSPDGSSSESYEISATFKPWGCEKVGLKLSYIDGEFLPGQQRRDAIRFGVSSLLGAATGRGGC
jgi:hypothetical protein